MRPLWTEANKAVLMLAKTDSMPTYSIADRIREAADDVSDKGKRAAAVKRLERIADEVTDYSKAIHRFLKKTTDKTT